MYLGIQKSTLRAISLYSATDLISRFSPAAIVIVSSLVNVGVSGKLSVTIAAIQFLSTILPLGLTNLTTQAYSKSDAYGSRYLTIVVYLSVFLAFISLCCSLLSKVFTYGPLESKEYPFHYFLAIIFASLTEVLCLCTYYASTLKRCHTTLVVVNISRLLSFAVCFTFLILYRSNSVSFLVCTLYFLPFLATLIVLSKFLSRNVSIAFAKTIFAEKLPGGILLMIHPFVATGASFIVREQFKNHFSYSILGGISVLIYTVSLFSSLGSGVLGHLNSKYFHKQPNAYFQNVLSSYFPVIILLSVVAGSATLAIFNLYLSYSKLIDLHMLSRFPVLVFLFFLLSAQVFSTYCYPVIGQNLVVNERSNTIVTVSISSAILSLIPFYLSLFSPLAVIQLMSIVLFSSLMPTTIYCLYLYCVRSSHDRIL